jgi:hypothetical protein
MGSEKQFWNLLRDKLPINKMYRVENKVTKGMPDIHYIHEGKSGWIELKYLDKFPKNRISSGLKLNQMYWSLEHFKNGGASWVLIRIGRDFIALVNAGYVGKLYNRPSRPDFLKFCTFYKKGNMTNEDWSELATTITG